MTDKEIEYFEIDGTCPLLLCLAEGRHKHPICPKCGAVGFGNISCDVCKQNVDMEKEMTLALLKKSWS